MAKKKKSGYKPYDTSRKQGETLEKYYKRLAKAADQRLVRLEGYQHEENYRSATKWSYARAMRDIKRWSGPDAKRFNTKAPQRQDQLQAKIEDIKTFLQAPSSTKAGITSIYQKKADTLNQKMGTNFDWETLGKYFESGQHDKLSDSFGSDTAVVAIGTIERNQDDIVKALKEAEKQHIIVDDITNNDTWEDIKVGNVTVDEDGNIFIKGKNAKVVDAINDLLYEHNYNVKDLLDF